MTDQPWWERFPEVLDRELRAFEASGIRWERDEEAYRSGVLKLRLVYTYDGQELGLEAIYPDLYPYFKPEVFAPGLRLDRHQNPINCNLCLVGRSTSRWYADDTAARLIVEHIPPILSFNRTRDRAAIAAVEEPQGEPASDYANWSSIPGSMVVFDSAWQIAGARGQFKALVKTNGEIDGFPVYRGHFEQVTNEQGLALTWPGPSPGPAQRLLGRWIRAEAAPLGTAVEVLQSLPSADRAYLLQETTGRPPQGRFLAGIVFPEEVQQGVYADGWLMLSIIRRHQRNRLTIRAAFLRTGRAGTLDLSARMPAVAGLATKKVTLLGIGAVGAPIALELARAGIGSLHLVDQDIVEPATVRRWPLGWGAFGLRKAEAVQTFLAANYPWTEVSYSDRQIGGLRPLDEARDQYALLREWIESSDLLIDATTELSVAHILSDLGPPTDRPLVVVNATPGAWGGMVAQFRGDPGESCWMCMRHALYGQPPAVDLPPEDPAGLNQPPGCADMTFTGTAFDLEEVSLEAVRVAAGLLSDDYPKTPWQLGVLSLRDREGNRVPPRWETPAIPKRSSCPNCGR